MVAPVIDTSSIASSGSGASSLTWAHTCTGSDLILLVTGGAGAFAAVVALTGVTYNGVTMGAALWSVNEGTFCSHAGFKLANPDTGGAWNVIATCNTAAQIAAIAASFTSAAGTVGTPVTKANTADDPISVVVTDCTSNDIVWGGIGTDSSTIAENQTLLKEVENLGSDSAWGAQYAAYAASVTMQWDLSGALGGALGAVRVLGTAGAWVPQVDAPETIITRASALRW